MPTNNQNNIVVENQLQASDSFIKLDKLLNQFNIFEATAMANQEIKHTKFLAYLLDPNESHGLGDEFLKAFISQISILEAFKNTFPRVLDIQFPYAVVTPEFPLGKEGGDKKPLKLDCLIQIPIKTKDKEDHRQLIVALENKWFAKENKNQTKNYSERLEKKFQGKDIAKLYLTLDEQDQTLSDEQWEHITYGNTILPLIVGVIDSLKSGANGVTTHLVNTLENYVTLLQSDWEGKEKADSYANEILEIKNSETFVNKIIDDFEKNKAEPPEIYIKHKKAIIYLNEFDNDSRRDVLDWWYKLPNEEAVLLKDGNQVYFYKETSVRTYLRFSVLTKENKKFLESWADEPERRWLKSSMCPINFQVKIEPKDKNKQSTFKCTIALILGPIRSDEKRKDLYDCLWGKINPNTTAPTLNLYWNMLKPSKTKTANPKELKEAITKLIFTDDPKNGFNFSEWVSDSAEKLNTAISEFIIQNQKANQPTPPISAP